MPERKKQIGSNLAEFLADLNKFVFDFGLYDRRIMQSKNDIEIDWSCFSFPMPSL